MTDARTRMNARRKALADAQARFALYPTRVQQWLMYGIQEADDEALEINRRSRYGKA